MCSELTKKTLASINNKLIASFWCLYCWLWAYFTPCSSTSIVNFEQVIWTLLSIYDGGLCNNSYPICSQCALLSLTPENINKPFFYVFREYRKGELGANRDRPFDFRCTNLFTPKMTISFSERSSQQDIKCLNRTLRALFD